MSKKHIKEEDVWKAVTEAKTKAEIMKVTDIVKIAEYGVMSTPAIVVNGKVKASRRIPETKEIKMWLKWNLIIYFWLYC